MKTCEWRPGSNRSIVSIEIAARQVRAEDRAGLIAAFNGRQHFDLVTIRRGSIVGHFASYDPTIRRMNFGRGQVCDTITRETWTDEEEAAMIFRVNGRFYGYVAVCGNLFELEGTPNPLPPAAETAPPSDDRQVAEATPASEPSSPLPVVPESFEAVCDCGSRGDAPGGGFGGPIDGGGGFHPPLPSVPEPATWSLLTGGLAAIYWLRTRRR